MAPEDIKVHVDVKEDPKDLLKHYRKRIEGFETERQHLLDCLDRISQDSQSLYRIRWENKKRAEEVRDLQKALSDAHTYLFEERERLLQLKSENESLRVQEVEDRRKIHQLLAMTQPIDGGFVDLWDKKKGSNSKTQDAGMTFNVVRATAKPPTTSTSAAPSSSTQPSSSSVIYPPHSIEYLTLRCQHLTSQLDEQKQFADERIASLLEDRRLREMDAAAAIATEAARAEQASTESRRLQEMLEATMRDLLSTKRDRALIADAAAEAQHALELAERKHAATVTALRDAHRKALETQVAELKGKAKTEITTMRSQVRDREKQVRQSKQLTTTLQSEYQNKMLDLEQALSKAKAAAAKAEARQRAAEEGVWLDVTAMRRRIAVLERRALQSRLVARLDDDERLDRLLETLEEQIQADEAALAKRNKRGGGKKDETMAMATRPAPPRAALSPGGRIVPPRVPADPLPVPRSEAFTHYLTEYAAPPELSTMTHLEERMMEERDKTAHTSSSQDYHGEAREDLMEEIQRVRSLLGGLETKLQSKRAALDADRDDEEEEDGQGRGWIAAANAASLARFNK